MAKPTPEELVGWARTFMDAVPHNRALGIELVALEPGVATMRLPYRLELVGNPDSGVIHGGPITAVLDACSGAAVFSALRRPVPIATLDLRVDYMRPATPELPIITRAECYKLTGHVAFTRAVAYHDDPEQPIATSSGTFMIATPGGDG
ncbi:MAG: PaaI family thioesterase [Myxococcales bacterium]|nr:PaaI family thioesterase [Myxococcales bacterium]